MHLRLLLKPYEVSLFVLVTHVGKMTYASAPKASLSIGWACILAELAQVNLARACGR